MNTSPCWIYPTNSISYNYSNTSGTEKIIINSNNVFLASDTEQNTLRIDLWTKDMSIDEMKRFFHQSLLSMADTFKKATGEDKIIDDLKDYCSHFADKMGLVESNQQ